MIIIIITFLILSHIMLYSCLYEYLYVQRLAYSAGKFKRICIHFITKHKNYHTLSLWDRIII